MAYVRGHRGDYDRWAASGLPEWSFEKGRPISSARRPWPRRRRLLPRRVRPIDDAVLALPRSIGRCLVRGRAGGAPPIPEMERSSRLRCRAEHHAQWLVLQRRCRVSQAGVAAAQVRVGALATRVLWGREKAVGVEYLARRGAHVRPRGARGPAPRVARDSNSPQLLMLSGGRAGAAVRARHQGRGAAARPSFFLARTCRITDQLPVAYCKLGAFHRLHLAA